MKTKLLLSTMLVALTALFAVSSPFVMASGTELVIADFDTGDRPNNIGYEEAVYALGGLEKKVFIAKYRVNLPTEKQTSKN